MSNIVLISRTISKFLLRIKTISNSLCVASDPVSYKEQVDVIFDRLPTKCVYLVKIVKLMRQKLYFLEATIDNNKKITTKFLVNVTHTKKKMEEDR